MNKKTLKERQQEMLSRKANKPKKKAKQLTPAQKKKRQKRYNDAARNRHREGNWFEDLYGDPCDFDAWVRWSDVTGREIPGCK